MSKELSKEEIAYLKSMIREVFDFPKPGISFKDITTLLRDAKAFSFLMSHLQERYRSYEFDCVAGIESRGFIFGAALASHLGIGFVPIRKKGKLPYTTITQKYALEYGYDEIEVHLDAFEKDSKVLLIDDLIATGGTAKAACELIEKTGARCVEACFVIELSFLEGAKRLDTPIYSIISYDG